ncbi:glycosyltransferase family 4 protein [Salinibacterium sp. GXW1014]|uniref:glycosyltransferase family 4 protein n=1 Tax=Salinibacterium sp. GXW1014 TaxID=3377838 RepID=UPI00383AEEA6
MTGLRVAIVSRIFTPEPAAASFRLAALARRLSHAGAAVRVVTSTPPKGLAVDGADLPQISIRRAPVLRDRDGYVRGYLNYLSFDIPAFFRILCGPKADVVVVEPPPTTGVLMRVACALRRVPYVYYAADVWADAVVAVGVPSIVSTTLRVMERFAVNGASAVLSVSESVTSRLRDLGSRSDVVTIGNGVDTSVFAASGRAIDLGAPYLLYAGTASEVHGATIFLDAFEIVLATHPNARLVFIGQGADFDALRDRAASLPEDAVRFHARMPGAEVGEWMRGAKATLASVRPDVYAIAFPTKLYASIACGTPVVYAGEGEARSFAAANGVGWSVDYSTDSVARAMSAALDAASVPESRAQLAAWAAREVSLDGVADRAAAAVLSRCSDESRSEPRQ